jgi:hypothetical protein
MNATREYGLTGVLDGLLSLMEDEKSVPGYRVSNIERGQAVWRADLAAQDEKRRYKFRRAGENSIIGDFLAQNP